MEKELQENTSKVTSEELSKILEEKDAEDNIINNKKPPIGKTLMEMYGLHTPTSAIIDYISNRKAFNTRLAIAVFLFITSTLPPVIMSNIFYIDSIGVLLMVLMIFVGVVLIIKGNNLIKNDRNILVNLELSEADYDLVNDEYNKWKANQTNRIILAVVLFIIGLFIPMIVDELFWLYYPLSDILSSSSLFLCVGSGVFLILYQTLNLNIFKRLLRANQRKIY